jgi:MFS family permease
MLEKSPLKNIFANRSFRFLYVAGLTSELGSFVTDTAVMLFVFALSGHNKTYLGSIRVLFLLCFTAGSLLGGPLGVRFNKRTLLLTSEFCRIPLILSLMYFHNIHFVMMANALIGFFTGIYNPSRQALINEIVPEKEIQNANSLFGSTMAVLHMAGPFIGATLYSINKGIFEVLILDLATYVIGIYLLFKITTIIKSETQNQSYALSSFWHDFKEGFNYVLSRFDLSAMLAYTLVMGFCIGVLIPLLIPFVSEVLHKGDREYGIVISLFGLGGIAGGFLSHYLSKHFRAVNLFLIGIFAETALMPIWIRTTNFYLSCLIFLIWGILVFIRIPAQLNYISATVPKEYMTRVHSFLDLVFVVPNISAGLLVAIIGGKLSTYDVLNYTSIIFIILTIAGLFSKRTKALLKASAH